MARPVERGSKRRSPLPAGLAVVSLFAAWIPGVGAAAALAALVLAFAWRRQGLSGFAVAAGVAGLLLGTGFTALYVLAPPAVETPEERRQLEAFERLFAPPPARESTGSK